MYKKLVMVLMLAIIIFAAASCGNIENDENSDFTYEDINMLGLQLWPHSYQIYESSVYYIDYSVGGLWKKSDANNEPVLVIDGNVITFIVYDDNIFYTLGSQGELNRISLDGNEHVTYSSTNDSKYVRKMDIRGDWIYVRNIGDRFYRIKTDFSESKLLDIYVLDFSVDDEWIYYTKQKLEAGDSGNEFRRMKLDGTSKQQLMEQSGFSIDYQDETIYYTDMDRDISKTTFFGTESQKVLELEEGGKLLKVVGEWIYYEDWGDKPGIYKVRIDGKRSKFITESDANFFTIWGDWLLCLSSYDICAFRIYDSNAPKDLVLEIISEWSNTEIIYK